ncbi:unnamed protein product, partial [Amoebophrya sp. A120]|eukprot:GSA120T00020056001.1
MIKQLKEVPRCGPVAPRDISSSSSKTHYRGLRKFSVVSLFYFVVSSFFFPISYPQVPVVLGIKTRTCPTYEPDTTPANSLETVKLYKPCDCNLQTRLEHLASTHLKPAVGSPHNVFAAQLNLHAPGGYGRAISDVVRKEGTHETNGLESFLYLLDNMRKQVRKMRYDRELRRFAKQLGVDADESGSITWNEESRNLARSLGKEIHRILVDPFTTTGEESVNTSKDQESKRTSQAQFFGGTSLGAAAHHLSSALTLGHIQDALCGIRSFYTPFLVQPCVILPAEVDAALNPTNLPRVRETGDHANDPAGAMLHEWLYENLLARGKLLWKSGKDRNKAVRKYGDTRVKYGDTRVSDQ